MESNFHLLNAYINKTITILTNQSYPDHISLAGQHSKQPEHALSISTHTSSLCKFMRAQLAYSTVLCDPNILICFSKTYR